MTSPQSDLLSKVERTIQKFAPELEKAVGVKRIDILKDEIHAEGHWWHIPVLARPEPRRSYPYYDLLAEIEIDLDENHHLKVLFVPTSEDEISNPPVH